MTIAEMGLELQHRGDDIRTLVQAYRDLDAYWDNRLWWAEDDGKRWAANSFGRKMYIDHLTEQIHSAVIQARKMMRGLETFKCKLIP